MLGSLKVKKYRLRPFVHTEVAKIIKYRKRFYLQRKGGTA
jgi:hypothetical protein